jgi:glycosyltransferase involved in cell wall biosynthesis
MEEKLSSAHYQKVIMKILLWHPTYVLGGGYLLLTKLIEELGKHPGVSRVTAAIHRDYQELITKDRFSSKVDLAFVHTGQAIDDVLRSDDIVYMVWPHGVAIPQVRVPTVCVFQDTILLDAFGAHTTDAFLGSMQQAVKDTVSRYSRIIVTSHYTKKRFVEIAGPVATHKVEVLPHIASDPNAKILQLSSATNTSEASRKSDQVESKSKKFLLYPANVSEHKNHLALMIALSKRKRKDISLTLCGYGSELVGSTQLTPNPYLNRLNKTISDRGLKQDSDYRALGYLDDATSEELMDQAMGLIMPTRAEGMGLPIHEALERGLPVIASDLPVLREHFGSRSDAILWVDPECPSEIAAAWDELCNRHQELSRTAESNRSCGVTWSDLADKTFQLLQKEVSRPPSTLHIPSVAPTGRSHRRRWLKEAERSIKKFWRRAG